jgi:hypothetical protein
MGVSTGTCSFDAVLQEFSGTADLVPIAPLRGAAPLEVTPLLSRADGLVAGSKTLSWWAGFISGASLVYVERF